MRTVIFDLDGTLADTSRDLIGAANACFDGLGVGAQLDPVADAVTAFRGGRAMLNLGLERLGRAGDTAEVERQYPLLLEHYDARIDAESFLYPGVQDCVAMLRSAGYRTGICTNKPEAMAVKLIAAFGVADLFDSLVGADTLPVRKPDPAPYEKAVVDAGGAVKQSLLIGDTDTDRNTALAVGVPCVLVSFGPLGDKVAEMSPDAVLPDYADLPAIVEGLIGRP